MQNAIQVLHVDDERSFGELVAAEDCPAAAAFRAARETDEVRTVGLQTTPAVATEWIACRI